MTALPSSAYSYQDSKPSAKTATSRHGAIRNHTNKA